MRDRLAALRLFARVARTASFSRAGRELGYSQPTASRLIAALEREVGATLFGRTTRTVVLTDAGAEYLARIEPLLAGLDEADQSVRGQGDVRGVLRVGVPASIAVREVIPRLGRFLALHPKLRLDLLIEDRRQELVREGVDVAIRLGVLDESSAVARLIGVNERVLAAAPSYLRAAGKPTSPADLADHAIIIGPPAAHAAAWSFERKGRRQSVRVRPRLTTTVNEVATAAAVAGLGIISSGIWGCRAELKSGVLVRLLPEWRMGSAEVHAVLTAGRAAKPSAKAFVDYLLREIND